MACFLVPTTEAVITTIIEKKVKSSEMKDKAKKEGSASLQETEHVPFSRKLKWLNTMLWGGSVLLAFEHIWHGEVTPFFPFLTAAGDPADTVAMLQEMSTVGVTMAVLVTAVWGGMVVVSNAIEKRADKALEMQKSN